jgi:tryptophan synthase alpha chain
MSPAEVLPGTARIDRALERIRSEGRVGLMAHLVLGYPTLEASRHIVLSMVRSGVDLIEVQLPFSDPTADGPTITLACHRALERGIKVADGLRFVAEMGRHHQVPFLFMSYYNLLFNYRAGEAAAGGRGGVAAFARDAAAAGAAGLIVPDLPPEEDQEGYPEACRESGLHPIYVVSPNVGEDRLRAVARVAGGFLYSTSRTGTTGKDVEIEFAELGAFLERARQVSKLPLAVGFSIQKREQIEALRGRAEIAVVGSHLIRVYEKHGLTVLERELRTLAGRKD